MGHLGDHLSCQSARLGDEARAALAGEIRPEPLALHAQAVLQLRQGKYVTILRTPAPGEAASSVREATSTPVISARSTLTFRCLASS